MQESLVSGRLDLALLYNAGANPDIESFPLLEEELFLIARKGDKAGDQPLPLRDLAKLPLVIPSRPNAIRMQVETELANLGLHPNVALEIDGISAIHDLVADGAGYAVLSLSAVSNFHRPDAFQVRRIVEPTLHCKLSIAASSRRPATLIQQSVMELVRETVASQIGGMVLKA
jgi:LysR family nitrogen assimilation transcriptional regulator